jgi:hypothetical protein
MLLREINAVHSKNEIKPMNADCGQNSEILNVEAGGKCILPSILQYLCLRKRATPS